MSFYEFLSHFLKDYRFLLLNCYLEEAKLLSPDQNLPGTVLQVFLTQFFSAMSFLNRGCLLKGTSDPSSVSA